MCCTGAYSRRVGPFDWAGTLVRTSASTPISKTKILLWSATPNDVYERRYIVSLAYQLISGILVNISIDVSISYFRISNATFISCYALTEHELYTAATFI